MLLEDLFKLVSMMIEVVGVLVSVAFMVLLERSVLGYAQLRKGPNSVGLGGLLQSFADAVKLFLKEQMVPLFSLFLVFQVGPILALGSSLFLWLILPMKSSCFWSSMSVLFMLSVLSLGVYVILLSGWSSNSEYAMLGGMRGVAQTISYEVSLVMIFLSFVLISQSLSLWEIGYWGKEFLLFFIYSPLVLCWGASMLAETNRTPFDFAEGESELVSGFNIEYSSGGFSLLFLGEYSSIIFMSYLFVILFFWVGALPVLSFLGMFFSFVFIWVRGSFPRHRYDKLMGLAWKSFLPISLMIFLFYLLVISV
uniref:NADH-ubiquinone oxidoreductase chain 1 n=1 Tax=Neelides sp. FZ-2019 TaxID=2583951 RepID=A0A6H0EVR4_9HEXA|nr:NADH dehydrogenase subunit 1 [Neelides sp. FZ-2019]